ncbi:PREDICTED: MMS19 nucleotide excision repair protein homolog isoform X2 [Rhagoletis zephyria]|uniref:MMS19 nucleotide excision repair protein homolog isoform X1 n=1 Tax=Rhagoletis zephyria TaxID=28612 RepID=UPI00081158DF|nr:PREDICTED: MMS19 nucleotide excision repair protein homolog isoform X1 [Rhagoletis zephyria]XP_017492935.1 PREDICTED: MMS19 nucleotide excision repair protein homolog isoform X2 [Rhagoletis zephyria]
MTPLTQNGIEEAFASEDALKHAATKVSTNIINGVYDISHVVEQMGFALTSPTLEQRVNGTKLLSFVLQGLPKDYLDRKQLEFVADFYTDRLKDQHSVLPAVIDGIHALVEMKELPAECVPKILNTFFKHTSCQSHQRAERGKWFKILKFLAEQYEKELKQMSGDFMYGLINSIDGERDPRNLDFIFTFMPDLIKRFSLLHLGEEMFEIFACYFPIDFTPSREDPSDISRDNLAAKLADCLVASPEFIEWVVPLALEKLESDLVVAKLDSLDLLRKSALKFTPKLLSQHFEPIWTALKNEIFPGGDNTDIFSGGLVLLRTILEQACSTPDISHSYQTTVLGTILPHLSDVNQRLYNPSAAIALVCVAGDPLFASGRILNTFLLKLNTKIASTDREGKEEASTDTSSYNEEQRIKVYTIIAQLFKIAALRNCLEQLNKETCEQIHADVIGVLRLKINSDAQEQNIDLKHAALSVLTESVPVISEPKRALLYKVLLQLVTHDSLELRCIELLELLGACHPVEVQSNCIDVLARNFSIYPNFVKRKVFQHLLPLVVQAAFTSRVLDLVWYYAFGHDIPHDVQLIALEALNMLLNSNDKCLIVELQTNNCLIAKLVALALGPAPLTIPVLEQIAAALCRIEQHLSVSEQYIIATEYLSQLKLQSAAHLYVAKGLLGRLHQDITLDDFLEWLLRDLTQVSLSTDEVDDKKENIRTVARQLLCSLVNRIEENEKNRSNLNKILAMLKNQIKDENAFAVETLAWLAKGLIVCGSELIAEIIETLTELLDHPTLASGATTAFEIIAAECDELFLTRVKFLYKQKLFVVVLNKLGAKLEAHSERHLIAFIYVLKSAPHVVQKMNIEKIGPLLFKSLEYDHTNMLCISLDICERFVAAGDEYFLRHLNHMIPSCLQLAKYQKSMKVRIGALNLLHDITKYPTHVLLTHKLDVVLELAVPLDDRKRLVRNAAVRTRNAWYLVGTNAASE